MSSTYAYLAQGLTTPAGLRSDLAAHGRNTAKQWIAASVPTSLVELLAELLARWAHGLGTDAVDQSALAAATGFLSLPLPVVELLAVAGRQPMPARELAALAVHLIDIAESMALATFVAELPHLSAKADRTGEAARNVGTARHLKG